MKHYIELTLLPDLETPLYFLWEKLYQQLHLALVETQDASKSVKVGVSFPEYSSERFQLGSKLRLFARSSSDLEVVDINKWLSKLSDYVHITSIRDVPDKVDGYAHFKRLQLKSNNGRLARRKAKREGITIEKTTAFFNGRKEAYSRAPFINIKSLSSDKRYRLMVVCEDAKTNQSDEGFSTYGLSAKSSVPVF